MNPVAEPVEELAQDQLGAGVDVDQALGDLQLLGDGPPEWRGVGLGVVVAARGLGLGRSDRLVDRGSGFSQSRSFRPSKVAPPFSISACISGCP
jgi:hypothetical protein